MKLKTKMLKNLISVLCAATIATSGVVTSVSAGNTFSSCCKKKGQPLTKKDEFKMKYDEAKSIYDEIVAGKRFLDKTEENRLNSIEMKFIKLSGMYDEIVDSKNDDKISAAIDKVGKLQKDMAKLLSKVQNALAKEESLPNERRKALNDRLYNFINKVYELEQWIINNQISDKDKDSAIVVDIAWIDVRCQDLENDYNALLNEKEINYDRYKKLIDEGDRFIKRIDHFKEKNGLTKLMAAAEIVNGIENPLRRRFYDVTSKTKDKAEQEETKLEAAKKMQDALVKRGAKVGFDAIKKAADDKSSRRIAEITAEIQKLREENTKIFESAKRDLEEREAANLMFVAGKNKKEAINGFNDVITNHAKKQAMNQLKKNNLGLKTNKLTQITENVIKKHFMNKFRDNDLGLQKKQAVESLNKVDNILINKIKYNKKHAMDQLKKNNLGLKTNKLAQITENVMNTNNKKYAMNKLINNNIGLNKQEATKNMVEGITRKVRKDAVDTIISNEKAYKKAKADQKRTRDLLDGMNLEEREANKRYYDELEAQRKKEKEMSDLKAKKDEFNKAKTEVKRQFEEIVYEDYVSLGLEIKDPFSLKVVKLKKESIEKKFEKLKDSTDMEKVYQLKDEVDKFQKHIEGLKKKIEQVAENKGVSEKKKAYKITKDNEDVLIKKVNKKIEEFKAKQSQAVQRLTEMPKDTLSIKQNVFKDVTKNKHTVESEQKIIYDIINQAALDIEKVKENFDLDSVEKFYKAIDNYIEKLDCSIKILNTLSNRLNLENKDGNEKKKTDRVAKKNKKVGFNLNPVYSN